MPRICAAWLLTLIVLVTAGFSCAATGTTVETMLPNTPETVLTASFIAAPTDYLASTETLPDSTLPLGNWLMTSVTRSHLRRDFFIDRPVARAEAEFQSDHPFDLYLNGLMIGETQDENGWHTTGLVDVAPYLGTGTNRVALRGFTSDEPMKTVGALRGCIRLLYADGGAACYDTSSGFRNGTVCDFWAQTEPEFWTVTDIPGNYADVPSYEVHPRLLRKSCCFRKALTLAKPVARARLYATAVGAYVPYLNGTRLTEARLLPGAMKDCREYQCYDVTALLLTGENVLAAETGNAYRNCQSWGSLSADPPAVLMQLDIEYADGSSESVVTDESWLVTASPRVDDDLQFGERYDARRYIEGWNAPGTPDGAWVHAVKKQTAALPFLPSCYAPVRAVREDSAVNVFSLPEGGYTCYDFGTNEAGCVKLTLSGMASGDVVEIRYAELIGTNGMPVTALYSDVFYPDDNTPGGRAPYGGRDIDVYVCRGSACETYAPEFTYTGFRYIYIRGASPEKLTVTRLVTHNDLPQTGTFQTSDPDLTLIWDAVCRSWRSNTVGGPTDCPTREKNFWNGDIEMFVNTANWYTDNDAFLSRWTTYGTKIQYDVYGWEDEEYILPLSLYDFYGDRDVLAAKYPVLLALIKKREVWKNVDILAFDHAQYRDHGAWQNVSEAFYAAAYDCRMYRDAARIARILGKTDDAMRFSEKFERLREAFNAQYYDPVAHDYAPHNQSGVVLPMAFGLAWATELDALADTLHGYVAAADYHLTCGFSSMEYVLCLLSDHGYAEDARRIVKSHDTPSLYAMITSHGGGTVTEGWSGYGEGGSSMNHYTFGSVAKWFFEGLGGLRITSPGFDEVSVTPCFDEVIGDCAVTHETPHGTLSSAWRYDTASDVFHWQLTIPSGCTAVCRVPEGYAFLEHGVPLTAISHTLSGASASFTVCREKAPTLDCAYDASRGTVTLSPRFVAPDTALTVYALYDADGRLLQALVPPRADEYPVTLAVSERPAFAKCFQFADGETLSVNAEVLAGQGG